MIKILLFGYMLRISMLPKTKENIPILPISSLTFASKSYRPLLWCQYSKGFDLDPGDLWLWPWDLGNFTSTWWFSVNSGSPCMVVLTAQWFYNAEFSDADFSKVLWKRPRNSMQTKKALLWRGLMWSAFEPPKKAWCHSKIL